MSDAWLKEKFVILSITKWSDRLRVVPVDSVGNLLLARFG